jgi:hypothetical protein
MQYDLHATTDRQDILVLHRIFAEAGKPRLSVKPRPELHFLVKSLNLADCQV